MKKHLLLLTTWLTIWSTASFAQNRSQQILLSQSFQSDSITKASFFRTIEQNLKLSTLQRSSAEIEVRLLIIPSALAEGSLLVIKSDGSQWKALEYKYFYKSDEQGNRIGKYRYVVDEKMPSKSWDDFWAKAIENKLLTLPGQVDLHQKVLHAFVSANWKEQLVEQKQIKPTGGNGYYLEIKVGDKYRYYGYENPDQHVDTPEVKTIVSLFNHLITQETASL